MNLWDGELLNPRDQVNSDLSGLLAVGTPAPAFELADITGKPVSLKTLRHAGKKVFLLFVNTECDPCVDLLPQIQNWQHTYTNALTTAVIGMGDLQRLQEFSIDHGLTQVLFAQDLEIMRAFRVTRTPSAIIVESNGHIGSFPVVGSSAIATLIATTVEQSGAEDDLISFDG